MRLKKLGILLILAGFSLTSYIIYHFLENGDESEVLIIIALLSLALGNLGIAFQFFSKPLPVRQKSSVLLLIVGLVIMAFTGYLKKQHLQGAGISLIEGILFLSFAYIPLLIKNRFEKWQSFTINKWVLRLLCVSDLISLILLLCGYLFRVQHWPGWPTMLYVGAILFAATIFGWNYVFKIVVRQRKEAEDKLAIAFDELNKKHEIIESKQKEILDSIHYAKRIQNALLPSKKYIDKNLSSLNKNNY